MDYSLVFPSSDEDKVQLELKTDLTAEIKKMIPHAEDRHMQLQKLIDDMLEQKVAKTDMKLRHIVTKGIEVQMFIHVSKYFVVFSPENSQV